MLRVKNSRIYNYSRFLFLVIISLFSFKKTWSQHCQFDFVKLISVVPFSGDTQNVVKGLEIQVAFHTTNQPLEPRLIFDSLYKHPPVNKYTNKETGEFERLILKPFACDFGFTQDHYTVMYNIGQHYPVNFYVLIRDIDGEKNGGFFGTWIIEIESKKHSAGLDTVYLKNHLGKYDSLEMRLGKYPCMSLCGTNPKAEKPFQKYEPLYIQLNDQLESFDPKKFGAFEDIQFEKWKGNHGIWEVLSRQNSKQTETNYYQWYLDSMTFKREWRCVRSTSCWHVFPHSERVDCVTQELRNGQWVETQIIHGCE